MLSKLSAKNKYEFSAEMSDEDAVRNIDYLAHSLRKSVKGGAGVPRYPLKLAIEACKKVVDAKRKAGIRIYEFEKWISDNARLLLGALDRIDYKAFTSLPHVDGVPRVVVLADFIVKYSGGRVIGDRVRKVMEAFCAVTPLSYYEIARLQDALTYRLLTEISLFAERALHYYDSYKRAKRTRFRVRCRLSDSYMTYYAEMHGTDETEGVTESDFMSARLGFENLLADDLMMTSAYVDSLRMLSGEMNEAFIVSLSVIDGIYRKDESYRSMSDKAKSDYLMQTAKCAVRNDVSEESLARSALALGDDLSKHFGEILYYYPDALRQYLRTGIAEPLRDEKSKVQGMYSFLVLFFSLIIAAFPAYFLRTLWSYLSVLPLFIASLHPVEYLLKRLYSMRLKPRPLPQMDYKIFPDECRTVVTVSRYLTSKEDVDDALLQIETLAASERDEALSFAVLADLPSSDEEWGERDEELLDYIRSCERSERVSFFVRKRTRCGNKWRAFERKRGAILDFLSAVKSGICDKFRAVGELPKAEYAILLDDDSELLPGTIRAAILAMAHPLNKEYDLLSFGGRIDRFSIKTHYTLRFLRSCGAEAYPFYSDFYADAFDCALYCGKAIVRIAPYLDKLSDFFPNERILSHDIIEGAVLRSTSVKRCVYEDAPATFAGDFRRNSRWQRGDIQLLPYAFCNKVKNRYGKRIQNPIAPIYKLIIFINGMSVLREAMLLSVLLFAYFSGSLFLLYYALSLLLFVKALSLILSLRALFDNVRLSHAVRGVILSTELLAEELLLLPFRAISGAFLFVVTSFKMAFRCKDLLEWTPFRATQKSGGAEDGARILLPTVLVLTGLTIALGELWLSIYSSAFMLYAFTLLISGRKIAFAKLEDKSAAKLKEYAVEIYRYFSDMSGEGLIPDNLQLFPYRMTSRMTSPTNLGFALLAEVCGAKLGLVEKGKARANISIQLDKLERLERYHGHLYNWYDVNTFEVMNPRVVSTVDSANFICCLSVLEAFAKEEGWREIENRAREFVRSADFSVLYDKVGKCLAIVRNTDEERLYGRYDLLASESRLAYYLAISAGLDPDCYFSLGRECSSVGGNTLLSWSGTAFEYMLPRVFLSSPFGSLMRAQEERSGTVQMRDRTDGVFGRSECGYYAFNDATAFKYKAVGSAELALSGETSDVIAPYASFLYLPTHPSSCLRNLEELSKRGAQGIYGFYEAIDYEHDGDIVKSYMTHHQGMSLAAITNAVLGDEIVRLFMSLPRDRSIRLLLTEDDIYERKTRVSPASTSAPIKQNVVTSSIKEIPDTLALCYGTYRATYDALGRSGASLGEYRLTKALDYSMEYGGVFVEIKEGEKLTSPCYYPFQEEKCYAVFSDRSVKYVNPNSHVTMEVVGLNGYQGELRKIVLDNPTDHPRKVTISLYADMILNTEDGYTAHPAFSDMFVRSEYDEEMHAAYLTRRGMDNKDVLSASLMVMGLTEVMGNCNSYNVIGRCGDFCVDYSIGIERAVAPRFGEVLYPCFGFSGQSEIPPHGSSTIYLTLLSDRNVDDLRSRNKQLELAYRSGAIELLGRDREQRIEGLESYLSIVGELMYRRTSQAVLETKMKLAEELAALGISPSDDILYFDCAEMKERARLLSAIKLSKKARESGVMHKTIVVAEEMPGAGMSEKQAIESAVRAIDDAVIVLDRKEGARFRPAAKIILSSSALCDSKKPEKSIAVVPAINGSKLPAKMCGEGGFTGEGYAVCPYSEHTLLPYANVVGGRHGGFVITESGGGFTFGNNSRENKLTVWTGDAVRDIRTEEVCLLTPDKRYLLNANHCEHKVGETTFTHRIDGVTIALTTSLFDDGRGKLYEIVHSGALPNDSRFSLSLILSLGWRYGENILFTKETRGYRLTNVVNGQSAFVYSFDGEIDLDIPDTKAGKITFSSSGSGVGRYRFALSTEPPREWTERDIAASKAKALAGVTSNATLSHSQDELLDRLYNVSLPYQLTSARLNARTGFYQCSGAYGFRDQLQDLLGLLLSDPKRVREQILLFAAHQYEEGDVQHWWHPPQTGVRTRISDDRLWLVYLTARYIEVTDDLLILDEQVPFLSSPILSEEEVSRYEIPRSGGSASLREHLLRAIRISLQYGEHSLLKIGSGDWNDGLDRVGVKGRGESVWLTMFAYKAISDALNYYPDAIRRELSEHLLRLKNAVLPLLKDGRYPLAFADDGKWLGTADAEACRLALNSQTWAVLSGVVPISDAKRAMRSADRLVDSVHGIVKLLSPPFDARSDYGYISAYPKGVRENGGQYTHAAVWYLKALLELGEGDEAYHVLSDLNPMRRCLTREGTERYMGEPYVLAGDVYGIEPYIGRAGWTWYTGSAGWLKYVLTEDFFGIKKRGDRLTIRPCFPSSFERLSVELVLDDRKFIVEYERGTEHGLYLDERNVDSVDLREIGENPRILCRFV